MAKKMTSVRIVRKFHWYIRCVSSRSRNLFEIFKRWFLIVHVFQDTFQLLVSQTSRIDIALIELHLIIIFENIWAVFHLSLQFISFLVFLCWNCGSFLGLANINIPGWIENRIDVPLCAFRTDSELVEKYQIVGIWKYYLSAPIITSFFILWVNHFITFYTHMDLSVLIKAGMVSLSHVWVTPRKPQEFRKSPCFFRT